MDEKKEYMKSSKKYKKDLMTINQELKEIELMKQSEIEELKHIIEDLSNKNKELKEQV